MAGGTAAEWAEFLKPLAMCVRNKPGREDFLATASAMAAALPDVPASLLVGWRQQEAMRRFAFWPSPADVAEWLAPELRGMRESAELRQRLAGPALEGPPERRNGPRSLDDILAVRARAREFQAEMQAREAARPTREPPRAVALSERQLLATYERLAKEGNAAAATRVAALRRRMGDEAPPHA